MWYEYDIYAAVSVDGCLDAKSFKQILKEFHCGRMHIDFHDFRLGVFCADFVSVGRGFKKKEANCLCALCTFVWFILLGILRIIFE